MNQTVDYALTTIETAGDDEDDEELLQTFYDDISISGTTWGEIKERAMQPEYLETSQFVRYLKKSERDILNKLIDGQRRNSRVFL